MKFFLSALIFLLSLGQLQRIQLTDNLAFYLHDLLVIGFLLIIGYKKIINNWPKIPPKGQKIFWLAFGLGGMILLAWLLALLKGRFDLRAILYSARLLSYGFFVYLLQRELANKSWLWRLVSFNLLMLGFVQYFFLPDLRFLIYSGYDDHFYRLVSTILDPAFTGLIFVFNLNYYLWQKKKNWALLALFATGLLLTYSRSSYLALFLSSLVQFFLSQTQGKKAILLLLLCFSVSLPFLPKQSGGDGVNLTRTISAKARIDNDQQILQSLQGSDWLVGQGLFIPNQNRQVKDGIPSHSHFADNLLVFLVSNLGTVGSLLLLMLILAAFENQQFGKKENLVLLASLIGHAMFNNDLTQSFVVLIFLGLWLSRA